MASTTRSRFPHEEYRQRPAAHRLAALRAAQGAPRRVRLQARLGAAELVRARRHRAARRLFHGPAELVRRGRRRASARARSASASSTSRPSPSSNSTGTDAAKALDWICANDVDKPAGRLTYTQLLNSRGGIEGDLTVARLAEDHFYIVTGTGFRTHDFGWIADHIGPALDASARRCHRSIRHAVADGAAGARRAGRGDRQPTSPTRRSRSAMSARSTIAGHPVRALRVTYVGELGWELHVPIDATGEVFDALMAAGAPLRHPAGRLPRAGIAAAGKGLPRLGLRHHAQRHSLRGRARLGGEAQDGTAAFSAARRSRGAAGAGARQAAGRLHRRRIRMSCCSAARRSCATASPSAISPAAATATRSSRPIGFGYVRNADGVGDDFLRRGSYELVVASEAHSAELVLAPLYDPAGLKIRS